MRRILWFIFDDLDFSSFDTCDEEVLNILRRSSEDFEENEFYMERRSCNIKNGSSGNGAKWVQWHLNKHGANLTVDGAFGAKSVSALKEFQQKHGLVADGICGKQTRVELKK